VHFQNVYAFCNDYVFCVNCICVLSLNLKLVYFLYKCLICKHKRTMKLN